MSYIPTILALLILTFLLAVLPGVAYLLSRYYKRQELIARIGFFLALSPALSGAFGGLLATAFLKAKDHGPIESWRKIFFYEYVATKPNMR